MAASSFDHDAMVRTQQAVVDALRTKDPVAFARLYTEDGVLYPPDGSLHRGRSAIEAAFAGMLAGGFADQVVRDVRLLADVDVAVEEGQAIAEFTGDDGTTSHRAHYVVIHQRQSDGSWLMHRDIWTAIPDGEPGAAGSDAAAAPGETG